jgi:DUF971 family protein
MSFRLGERPLEFPAMPFERRLSPKLIKAPHGARVFEIEWATGERSVLPHEILRGYCPCATCQGHSGQIAYQAGGNLELVEIRRVGNYALALGWADGHDSGIYSFDYLHRLGLRIEREGVEALKQTPEERKPI